MHSWLSKCLAKLEEENDQKPFRDLLREMVEYVAKPSEQKPASHSADSACLGLFFGSRSIPSFEHNHDTISQQALCFADLRRCRGFSGVMLSRFQDRTGRVTTQGHSGGAIPHCCENAYVACAVRAMQSNKCRPERAGIDLP